MQIKFPTHFVDGTPIPVDYFKELNKLIDIATDAENQNTLDDLERYAAQLNISGRYSPTDKE